MKKIELYGHITKNGEPLMSGTERFKQIFKVNPGKKFFMEIMIVEKGTNDHHIWYIMKMIVPAIIRGNKELGNAIGPQEAVETIRLSCPFLRKDSRKGIHKLFDFKSWQPDCQMSTEELEMAIEWLHIYCLENFDIAVGNYKSI